MITIFFSTLNFVAAFKIFLQYSNFPTSALFRQNAVLSNFMFLLLSLILCDSKMFCKASEKKKKTCTPEKLVSRIALVCVSYFHWRKCSFYPSIGSKWSDNGKHTEFSFFFFLYYTALMTQYTRESENIQLCMSGTYGMSKKVEKTIKHSKSNY